MFSNESLFFLHILAVVGSLLIAERVGKHTLVSLIALQAVLANLFVVKQISLFALSVTCSDVFAVGGILGLNLLQEKYGREEAKKALHASFLSLLFFLVMSTFHLGYEPHVVDETHAPFSRILSHTTRISLASIGVFFVVQKIDIKIFSLLQKGFKKKYFPLRVGLSLTISQCLDTLLFSFVGLYGIVTSLFDIIVMSCAIKLLIIVLCSILLGKRKNVPV